MRLIFSRKGFDSGSGGIPSPIFPDNRMFSLPIPSENDPHQISDLNLSGIDIGVLVSDLSDNRLGPQSSVHTDPDLCAATLPRLPGWKPSLGQIGAAQSHLMNEGVGPGDLFLFFGWFRRVEQLDGKWRYVPDSPDVHVLFGWLQIGQMLKAGSHNIREGEQVDDMRQSVLTQFPWLVDHPHMIQRRWLQESNTIYLASEALSLDGKELMAVPGGGVFEQFAPELQLTAQGQSRSIWKLPAWFAPGDGRPALSYHSKAPWTPFGDDGEAVLLKTVGRGQEFVLDCAHYPEANDWINKIFAA